MDMTLLERQAARLKWVHQSNYLDFESCPVMGFQYFFDHSKPGMYLGGSGDILQAEVGTSSVEIDHSLSRTSSCQTGVPEAEKEVLMVEEDVGLMDNMQGIHGRGLSNKRKPELVAAEESKGMKMKGEAEVNCKAQGKNMTEVSADDFSKENQKKPDYIHVRARRGQATDSHSLAERARREKISKKMKCLQDLVPGCNKITGRAGMLDEIINYVQSLQRQVEFLSMKLAALNPRPESSTDNFSVKEFPAYGLSFPTSTVSSGIAHLPHLQVNLVPSESTGSEQEALTNPSQIAPEGATSSSPFIPAQCLDSSCFPQVQSLWDHDMLNLHNVQFHQG